MKLLLIIALLAQFGISATSTSTVAAPYQLKAQEVIKAINKVRVNPVGFADYLKTEYLNKGVLGTTREPKLYFDLEAQLRALKPLPPLVESIAIDYSAWLHSYWMATNKVFAHKGINGVDCRFRLLEIGTFVGRGWTNEVIAGGYEKMTGDDFVKMWLYDHGYSWKGHRMFILSLKRPEVGCGYALGRLTCVSADPINLLPKITDADLAKAGLSRAVNDKKYTGV